MHYGRMKNKQAKSKVDADADRDGHPWEILIENMYIYFVAKISKCVLWGQTCWAFCFTAIFSFLVMVMVLVVMVMGATIGW